MTLGVVVIGRNEGTRLHSCLRSVREQAHHIVYVDSGSSDGSVEFARQLGVEVVEFDDGKPFTAGRARNAGYARLKERLPELELVQFIDGDCQLAQGWLTTAIRQLEQLSGAAIVCGRRRERFPERTVYNRLCDLEWNTPVGEARSCGGDFLVRAAAFDEVGGFRPGLIAGEEPDLCHRLRERGWRIYRVDAEMTLHDAAMSHFRQWWKRNVRSGYATAEALKLRGRGARREHLRKVVGNLLFSVPATWPLLWWRVYRRMPDPSYATFIVLGKLPHSQGQLTFWLRQLRRSEAQLIEYK